MVDIIKYGEFKSEGIQKQKHQIILTHTSRHINEYLNTLRYRFNGKYKKIPNYIITREGKVLQLLGDTEHSLFFNDTNVSKNSIVVCLENLGWLEKEPLKDYYVNWIGDIYKGKVYEKKWREHFFWHPYTEIQLTVVSDLCRKLFDDMSIKPQCIGHNTKINGIEKYEGVVTNSNFDLDNTDVNPSFNFEEFLKKIENE